MTKKKLSGQTITIIILAILLLVTVVFGGVYAYYSQKSSEIKGTITLANLKIEMTGDAGASGSSLTLSTHANIVPGQTLDNSALTVTNNSNTNIYLVIAYTINCKFMENRTSLEDDETFDFIGTPVIDILNNGKIEYLDSKLKWEDYLFKDTYTDPKTGEEVTQKFRYLICPTPFAPQTNESDKIIPVIPKDALMLNKALDNHYQACEISFTFQAYCIGSDGIKSEVDKIEEQAEKCNFIMNTIYQAFSKKIINVIVP